MCKASEKSSLLMPTLIQHAHFRGKRKGMERYSNWPKATQPMSDEAKILTQVV